CDHRQSPPLQVHLWSSRIAHSGNGNRAFSRDVVVQRLSNRTARIHYRICRRLLAINRRTNSVTGTSRSRGSLVWVAVAYGVRITVVLNLLFLPNSAEAAEHRPKPTS